MTITAPSFAPAVLRRPPRRRSRLEVPTTPVAVALRHLATHVDELAEDAAFLRKLKPSLIAARARGEVPTDGEPGPAAPLAPAGPQHGKRPKAPGSGPNPFLVVGAALAIGFLLAKVIDWRGHAHPKHD